MKLIIKLVISYLCYVEIIDSKMLRLQLNDELYAATIDQSVRPFTEYVDVTNVSLEQIDDYNVQISGHGQWLKSFDPKLPMQADVRTKHFENSVWTVAMFRLTIPSMCEELVNPSRFWYNFSKLWISCPPQKGDIWVIEEHMVDMRINMPPSIPTGPWQAYVTIYQFSTIHKIGIMFQVEAFEMH